MSKQDTLHLLSPLAVQPAGALSSAQSELRGAEEGVAALAVVRSVLVHHTLPSSSARGVAGPLAELLADGAAGGQEGPQVAQAAITMSTNCA